MNETEIEDWREEGGYRNGTMDPARSTSDFSSLRIVQVVFCTRYLAEGGFLLTGGCDYLEGSPFFSFTHRHQMSWLHEHPLLLPKICRNRTGSEQNRVPVWILQLS